MSAAWALLSTRKQPVCLCNNDNNNIYICFAIISGSGICDASQLPPDRLVLSSVVLQMESADKAFTTNLFNEAQVSCDRLGGQQ